MQKSSPPFCMPPAMEDKGERLAKTIAAAGICSRRDAEKLIVSGKVKVDGKTISTPALNVTGKNIITINDKIISATGATRLFLFHKPRGVLTTHKDPENRKTLFEILPANLPRLISVGRLDLNTEGLMLLTNSGSLARNLELPSSGIPRVYRARVFGTIDHEKMAELKKGATVEGFKYAPIQMTLDKGEAKNNFWMNFILSEGKNREIRKLAEYMGLKVSRLIRVSYGVFELGTLEVGKINEVPEKILKEKLGRFL